jgi:hypothetical protein
MSKFLLCLAMVGLLGGCSRGLGVRTSHAADGGPDGFGVSSGADAGSLEAADGAGGADTSNTRKDADGVGSPDTSDTNDFVRPDGGIAPLMPEMEPVQIDNPTGTRLVQLVVGDPVLALFEDGSVYYWDYTANDNLDLEQLGYPLKLTGLDGTVQLDVWTLLAETGTVG